ncbi:hypothetical protein KP509_23G026000 [Ceratopteris richardii]|uniref:Uncharacterized protein n=1 Tax=Ceratopteris richardii TaxID=49495 RepID=A0A8T2RXX8_CERRI|nr:hypothetical protein KP509_23G026000 [Ceratopteris richardii]
MDDFDAPSFSLGLDEEITIGSQGRTLLQASNPFKIVHHNPNGDVTGKLGADIQKVQAASQMDSDSDFEIMPSVNTPRIMKRLQRKSGHSVLVPSANQQQACFGSPSIKDKGTPGAVINSSNEGKACLSRKNLLRKSAGCKAQTLPNMWRGLDVKVEGRSPLVKAGIGSSIESSEGRYKKSSELANIIHEKDLETVQGKQVAMPQVPSNGSAKPNLNGESVQAFHGISGDRIKHCEYKVAPENRYKLSCKDTSPTDGVHDQTDFRNDGITTNLLESYRKGLDGGKPSSCNPYSINSGSSEANTSKGNSEEVFINAGLLNDLPCEYSGHCKENPQQNSCRTVDHKRGISNVQSFDTCVESEENSANLLQKIPATQASDCLFAGAPGKVNNGTTFESKTTSLQSFWKSLNDRKADPCGAICVDDDEIENSSSEDNMGFQAQPAKKLSLSGQKLLSKSSVSSGVDVYHTPHITLGENVSKENTVNSRLSGSSTSYYTPQASIADAKTATDFTFRHSIPSSSTNYEVNQCHNVKNMPLNSSNQYMTDSLIKRCKNKLNDISSLKINLWPGDEGGTQVHPVFLNASEDAKESDQRSTPLHQPQASTSSCREEYGFPFDRVQKNDPRVANLLHLRFPHFLSLSALKTGNFGDVDHIFIDYENQFMGSKAASRESGPGNLKKQSRQKSAPVERKKAVQRNQRHAIADNDGWIQSGARHSVSSFKNSQNAGQASQNPYNDDTSITGPGHWITENGRRIYVTKDGRKLSGSSAYRQHMKDSGKHSKKTKKHRPRSKKQKRTTN